MLSKESLCFTCDNRKICRHFYNANMEFSLSIEIKQCDNVKLKENFPKINSTLIANGEPKTALLNTTPSLSEGYIDLKKYDTIGKVSIEKLEVEKSLCEICKNKKPITELLKCNKCGKTVCQSCSNTFKDIDTKELETICYECKPDDKSIDWDIKSFVEEEDKNGRKNNKSSSTKSKKS